VTDESFAAGIESLREQLSLLAAPPSVQEAWLDEHDFPIDEMYLQLVDSNDTVAPWLREGGRVGPEFSARFDELLAYLDGMGGMHHPLWTDRSLLHTAPEWAEVRRLAAQPREMLD
jgi:hypothetical protein